MTRTLLVARNELRLRRRDPFPLFVLVGEQGFGRAVGMLLGFATLFTAVTLWAFRAEQPKES